MFANTHDIPIYRAPSFVGTAHPFPNKKKSEKCKHNVFQQINNQALIGPLAEEFLHFDGRIPIASAILQLVATNTSPRDHYHYKIQQYECDAPSITKHEHFVSQELQPGIRFIIRKKELKDDLEG